MVSENNPPDWPPPGWEVKTKKKDGRKTKVYINSKTGKKLYSKPEVLRYIAELAEKSSGDIETHHVKENKIRMSGWKIEKRFRMSGIRAGTAYKRYIDPITKKKFLSIPEVMRHLAESSERNQRGENGQSSSKTSSKSEETPKNRIIKTPLALPSWRLRRIRNKTMSSARVRASPVGVSSPNLSPESGRNSQEIEMNVSSKREETPKRRTRRSRIQALSEAVCNEQVKCRKTRRLSSTLRSASSCKQSSLSHESARNSQPLLEYLNVSGTKETVGMTKSQVQDSAAEEVECRKTRRLSSSTLRSAPSSKQSSLSHESARNSQPLLENLNVSVGMTKSQVQDYVAEEVECRKTRRLSSSTLRSAPSSKQSNLSPESARNSQPLLENLNVSVGMTKSQVQDAAGGAEEVAVDVAIQGCNSNRKGKRVFGDPKLIERALLATSSIPSTSISIQNLAWVIRNEKQDDVDIKHHQSLYGNEESVLTTQEDEDEDEEPPINVDDFLCLENYTLDFNLRDDLTPN